jgi:hypothetical protein
MTVRAAFAGFAGLVPVRGSDIAVRCYKRTICIPARTDRNKPSKASKPHRKGHGSARTGQTSERDGVRVGLIRSGAWGHRAMTKTPWGLLLLCNYHQHRSVPMIEQRAESK